MRLKPFKKEKEISKETIKKNAPLLLVPLVIGVIGITYLVSSFAFYNYEVDDAVLANATVGDFAPSSAMIARKNLSDTSSFWKYTGFSSKITSIEFLPDTNKQEIVIPEETIESFDVSVEQNETIKAWVVDDGSGSSTYKLYFQGKNKIILNENSSNLFYNFSKATSITGLENVDTSKVTNMSSMFAGCSGLTNLDLTSLDTSNVTNMSSMFYGCRSLTNLDLTPLDTSNVTNISSMFSGCSGLTNIDLTSLDTSNVTNMSSMFTNCNNLTSLDLSNFDTSKVTNMSVMFDRCSSLTSIDLSNFDTSKVTGMSNMFYNCSSLTSIDLSNFDTSKVTNMGSMFSYCKNLTNLDVSAFDTSQVTNMSSMFNGCINLSSLNLSNFDTSKVTDMSLMFYYSDSLMTLDLSNFDTSKVTDMSQMFSGCSNLPSLDVSNFDTSKVTNMSLMFSTCRSLPSLDLSNFDTSKVTNMSSMFSGCSNLSDLKIDNFDFDNVTSISYKSGAYISGFLEGSVKVMTSINIKNNSITQYPNAFLNAATAEGSQITINYTEESSDLVDLMIATKSSNSNVVKGNLITSYNITIDNENVTSDFSRTYVGRNITLSTTLENRVIKSFKLNGELIEGNTFTMPEGDAAITDVEFIDIVIVESEHNPYPNNLNNQVYYENTFEGAKSLTVTLEYQTESTTYDWIYLYDSSSATTPLGNKKYGGTAKQTETITIDNNYLKIVFRTDGSGNTYYGFKATIVPNY